MPGNDDHGIEKTLRQMAKCVREGTGWITEPPERIPSSDEVSVLIASALKAAGHRTRFVVVSSDADKPYHHVYVEFFHEKSKSWMKVDPWQAKTKFPRQRPGEEI